MDAPEQLLAFDRGRSARIIVIPALFGEGNKLRHFTVQTMRLLDRAGVDSLLSDLPGCNESLAPLAPQTLAGWRAAMGRAATQFRATHALAIRAGALLTPPLPGWRYAPQPGPALLRAMLRARILASREAGIAEDSETLLARGRSEGLDLAGFALGPAMIAELERADLPEAGPLADIAQGDLGGAGLWLRAEPGHDPAQARALADILIAGLRA